MATSTPLKGTECLQTSFPSESPIFGHQPDEIPNMEIVTDANLSVLESGVLPSERYGLRTVTFKDKRIM
jgi:hypothetical protein